MSIDLHNYRIVAPLYESARTLVYRGVRDRDSQPVIVKLLRDEFPAFNDLVQFRNQYRIAKSLNVPGIVRPISLETDRNRLALVMKDEGEISLLEYVASRSPHRTLSVSEFLDVAIQLAQILEQLYCHRVIHKDIKPQNILIHPETRIVRLIDFSISSILPREEREIQNPNVLEGTLAYLSPEQTGRMNRGIDYRADFYALGVTFYELLVGQVPFRSNDPLELVHCHIARQPVPPIDLNSSIPSALSKIVLKLMAKIPEDRYQSASGLRYDLEQCRDRQAEFGEIGEFEIGTRDICDRFTIPEQLYGRETEKSALLAAFVRVASPKENRVAECMKQQSNDGTSLTQCQVELALISGVYGIGKSALVREVQTEIVRRGGYFISGKFDFDCQDVPFSAWIQACRTFVAQISYESAPKQQDYRDKIRSALGQNGRVLSDAIPELDRLLGTQPPIPELEPLAHRNRFNLLLQKLLWTFTELQRPLAIFLDDLQWADSASLKFLELFVASEFISCDRDNVMESYSVKSLLVAGTYRSEDSRENRLLTETISRIGSALKLRQSATVDSGYSPSFLQELDLKPLHRLDILRLVADTLHCSPKYALPLTDLILQKNGGNPFLTKQLLEEFYREGSIYFRSPDENGINSSRTGWQYDLDRIAPICMAENTTELVDRAIDRLPEKTKFVLKIAACIGSQFDLETIAIANRESLLETANDLWTRPGRSPRCSPQ